MVTPDSNTDYRFEAPGLFNNTESREQVFRLKSVVKRWPGGQGFELSVPELAIFRGEKVALTGLSGCGKSTLLDMLAMILPPDSSVEFTFFIENSAQLEIAEAWRRKDLNRMAKIRMHHLGYVLQTGGLFPFLTIRDNISLTLKGLGISVKNTVEMLAEALGIERHLKKYPAQLSVGERQRVAIARAMAHQPSVVIADEPTASLDPIHAEEIMALFTELADKRGVTLIMATHEWKRVEDQGFRLIQFDVRQNSIDGSVQTNVVS